MDGIFECPFLTGNWGSLSLNLLEAAMYYGDTSWNFSNTRSPFNRIYFMMDGEAYLENEEERVELLPGNVYLVPAECRYSYVCPSTMQKFYIHFTMELLPGVDLFSHLGKVWGLPYEWDFLEDILGAVQKESVGGLLYLKAVFSRLVYDFFEQGAGGDAYLDSFRGFYRQRAVLDYLEGHLSAGLRIQELADAMDMPVHQLSRSFQQDTKMGLKEYMSRQLAQRARQMLGHTDMPVWEVAETLGFTDPYYFSRFFKKYEKLSPREYRKLRF
ncbi:MAG: helix-turn-helix domain-containing protein [Enterocloster sp.]